MNADQKFKNSFEFSIHRLIKIYNKMIDYDLLWFKLDWREFDNHFPYGKILKLLAWLNNLNHISYNVNI